MFFKKKKVVHGDILSENLAPATLPTYGKGLDSVIPCPHSISSESYKDNMLRHLDEDLGGLVTIADTDTAATALDSYLSGEKLSLQNEIDRETVSMRRQASNIRNKRGVRAEILRTRISILQERALRLQAQISPLEGFRHHNRITLFGRSVSAGLLITLAAMLFDGCLNYAFLEHILTTSTFMLVMAVVGMSIMSDASMAGVGYLLSHRDDDDFMPGPMFKSLFVTLCLLFAVSVLASVLVRFGSMATTYGTYDAEEEVFIHTGSFTVAEYAISGFTSLLTTATGVLSLIFSLDQNGHKADLRSELEEELKSVQKQQEAAQSELSALEGAADPFQVIAEERAYAEKAIPRLNTQMKLHARKVLAEHIGSPEYLDGFTASCNELQTVSQCPQTKPELLTASTEQSA